MKKLHLRMFGLLACLFLLASSTLFSACGGGDWENKLKGYVEDSLLTALKTTPAQELIKTFCQKGDLDKKIFSVRSFEGRLCDKKYVKGLDILGGISLFLCWDSNHEDYQDSGCAGKALKEWSLSKSKFDKGQLLTNMKPVLLQYLKEAEDVGGDVVPYYPQVKFVACLFDSSLYGPGAELHNLLCN